MRRYILTLFAVSVITTGTLQAKGPVITRVTIQGDQLQSALEIPDARRSVDINLSTGKGITYGTQKAVPKPPDGARRFQVTFYVKDFSAGDPGNVRGEERLSDVVGYAFDAATQRGYFYLPGRKDNWPEIKGRLLFRGEEGVWIPAEWNWDKVVGPLLDANR